MNGIEFVDRIDKLLAEKHQSRVEISNALGYGRNKIAQWKKNNTIPSAECVFEIAQYLGVSMEYLLTGQEKKVVADTIDKKQIIDALESALNLLR